MMVSPLPRYFFHFASPVEVLADQEGVELADLTAAHQHAMRLVCKMLPFFSDKNSPRHWVIQVESQSGGERLTVLFPARADRIIYLKYLSGGRNTNLAASATIYSPSGNPKRKQ